MEWLTAHWTLILGILLIVSETIASVVQLAFPDNKGISGIMAGIIKFLQSLSPPPVAK